MLESKEPMYEVKEENLSFNRDYSKNSVEERILKKSSASDCTVREMASINAEDLKNRALLSKVAEKLRSEKNALGQQLVKQRMHHSAWIQHTNTVKECIDGLDLLKSLKTLDPLSTKIREGAILESKNEKLAQFFQEAKQMLDQMKPLAMRIYEQIGIRFYKIHQQCEYLEEIVKLSERTYKSIHREVNREDRTIGQAELEAYRKQIAEVLEACSNAEASFARMSKKLPKFKEIYNILKDSNIYYTDDTGMSIDTTSSSIEATKKSIREYQDNYSKLREKLHTYQPSQEVAFESMPSVERVKRVEIKLKEYYPEAARDMPETVRDLAIAKDILMDSAYCDKIMLDLQDKMKEQGFSLKAILQKSERELGYGDPKEPQNERKTYVNAAHVLRPEEFLELLKNRVLTFDAVAIEHGSYSHRLQWYILGHAHKQGKIKTNPAELYQHIADQRFIEKQSEWTVWVDIFDSFQPRAFSVSGLPENPSAWQKKYRQAYSHPYFVTEHLIKTLPPGPLKKELALTRLRQLHFGLDSVVDTDAPIVVTTPKGIRLDNVLDTDSLLNHIRNKVLEIEQNKINKIDTFTGEYKDREMLTKKNQLQEELKGMNLEQLEQRYIALKQKVPASFDLEGDYGKARARIIQENGSI